MAEDEDEKWVQDTNSWRKVGKWIKGSKARNEKIEMLAKDLFERIGLDKNENITLSTFDSPAVYLKLIDMIVAKDDWDYDDARVFKNSGLCLLSVYCPSTEQWKKVEISHNER